LRDPLPFRLTDTRCVSDIDSPRSKRCEGKTTLSLRRGAYGPSSTRALNAWKTKIDGCMQVCATVGRVYIVVSIEQCCIQLVHLLNY